MKAVCALLALGLLVALSAKDKKPIEVEDKIVELDPFKIKSAPISSFAFDIRVYSDKETGKVARIFITGVQEDGDAARLGLQAGDEIIKVDGMAVKGMEGRVAQDSQLGALFLNRAPGEPLNIEVITHRTEKLTVHAQRVLPGAMRP